MRRGGFQLTEVLVALVLATGPLLLSVHLINNNARGAHFNMEQSTARTMLVDLSELMLGETLDDLRVIGGPDGKAPLNRMIRERVGQLPGAIQKEYLAQLEPLIGHFFCELKENAGGKQGLARLALAVTLDNGAVVQVVRFFRPGARLPGLGL